MNRLIMVSLLSLSMATPAAAGDLISASPDVVYQAAMEVALDLGAMPSTSNDKLRFFKTDAVCIVSEWPKRSTDAKP